MNKAKKIWVGIVAFLGALIACNVTSYVVHNIFGN